MPKEIKFSIFLVTDFRTDEINIFQTKALIRLLLRDGTNFKRAGT